MTYAINDIYKTIQAEGVNCGLPMVVLRLQGCDVACPFCDTKETWGTGKLEDERQDWDNILSGGFGEINPRWMSVDPGRIAEKVACFPAGIKWVMLTGGEPCEQDLTGLLWHLHDVGKFVALETSGTCKVPDDVDWVCVSPKWEIPGSKGLDIEPQAIRAADELKFVIGAARDLVKLNQFLVRYDHKEDCEICLQPMSLSEKATDLVLEVCQSMGWRASIQVHKYLRLK